MLYDTVLLGTFAAICDAGSFTKAAREVNLTQSAVSLHVKRLEDQVGSRLIMRNTRGVRLTEQGEILLSYARRILALYKEAEHRLSRDIGGLVRIGAAEYFDLHTLSALLGQFSARYPAVRLQIELGIGPDISALLDEGELDLVIVSNEIREGDGVPLARERRSGQPGGQCISIPRSPRRLRSIRPIAGGGSSPWKNSTGLASHGLSCCRAQARPVSSQHSTQALPSPSFPSSTCRIA